MTPGPLDPPSPHQASPDDPIINTNKDILRKYLIDSLPIMMGVLELKDGQFTQLLDNKRAREFYGLPEGALTGRRLREVGVPPESEKLWESKAREARDLKAPVRFESISEWEGKPIHIESVGIYLGASENGGEIYSYLAWDNTKQFELERELLTEKERFELALEGSSAGLWDWDIITDRTFFSLRWKSMLGYEEHEVANTYAGWEKLVHPEDLPGAAEAIRNYLRGKSTDYQLEHRLLCRDGSYRWILSKGACVRNAKGDPVRFTGWHVDIHEIKSTLEELKRQDAIIREQQVKIISSAKMSSLGEMAGGIAHEINNPLAIISLCVNQIRDALNQRDIDQPRLREATDKIDTTIRRIGKIVKGLRAFSRSGEHDPFEFVPVAQIVTDTLELCREKFRSQGVDLRLPPQLPTAPLQCRAVQISQVLLNLLSNAYDAVHEREGGWVEIDARVEGTEVVLSVTDSGTGIAPEVANRVLDPFFTTKDVGEGTGLGLSIAKGIIEDHRGRLEYVANSPSTRFQFRLPLQQP